MHNLKYIFMVLTIVTLAAAGNVLTEKPSFVNTCKISDPDFSTCTCKNIVGLLTEWKSGVPGLKNVVFDPFKIKRMTVDTGTSGPIALHIELSDMEVTWLTGMTCKESSFDPKKLVLKMKLHSNKLTMASNYAMKGSILNLGLDGQGKGLGTFQDSGISVALKLKLREEDGYTFTDVQKVRVNVDSVSNGHLQLDNLFNGDKALEDGANLILNQSWDALFDLGRPAVNEAMEIILKDRMSKMFAYVPATYFFDGLPSA